MPWKTRGGRRYYYRSVRRGGRVRSEYIGAGESAELIAAIEAARQDVRECKRQTLRAEADEADRRERLLDDLVAEAKALAAAALLDAGYHQHKGQWRKCRGR